MLRDVLYTNKAFFNVFQVWLRYVLYYTDCTSKGGNAITPVRLCLSTLSSERLLAELELLCESRS